MGWRLRKFENRFLNIIQKDARSRLMLFMQELLNDQKGLKITLDDSAEIPNYLTQDEIAQLIGTSRQTVATIFGELREAGILIYSQKKIQYRNITKNFRAAVLA